MVDTAFGCTAARILILAFRNIKRAACQDLSATKARRNLQSEFVLHSEQRLFVPRSQLDASIVSQRRVPPGNHGTTSRLPWFLRPRSLSFRASRCVAPPHRCRTMRRHLHDQNHRRRQGSLKHHGARLRSHGLVRRWSDRYAITGRLCDAFPDGVRNSKPIAGLTSHWSRDTMDREDLPTPP